MKNDTAAFQKLSQLLIQCRDILTDKVCIAPNLFFVELQNTLYPVYYDILDNGKELMFFQTEDAFVRSIIHGNDEDPDLLFTSALTIDFLDQVSDSSDLLLLNEKDLLFRNEPGFLPMQPSEEELAFLIRCISQLLPVFQSHSFPAFSDHKALYIREDGKIEEKNYVAVLPQFPLLLSQNTLQDLSHLPLTNEHILLQLYALPEMDLSSPYDFEIRIRAIGKHFHKEMTLNLYSYTEFGKQCQIFLYELLQERGNVEQIHIHSYNLWHLLQPMQPYAHVTFSKYDSVDTLFDLLLQAEEVDASGHTNKKLLN